MRITPSAAEKTPSLADMTILQSYQEDIKKKAKKEYLKFTPIKFMTSELINRFQKVFVKVEVIN